MGRNHTGSLRRRACPAFTAVELMVSVAIVSVLFGVLMPSISATRAMARQAGSSAMQRQLVVALHTYGLEHNEWIPGASTSGIQLWNSPSPSVTRRLSQDSRAPVQNVDWMSPSLGLGVPLPRLREQRFHYLLEEFADPEMETRSPVFAVGANGNSQMADWVDANASSPPRGVSFLMPMNFQLFGGRTQTEGRRRIPVRIGQETYAGGLLTAQIRTPLAYMPRLDRVGAAESKIAIADGFRYLDSRRGTIDFDASYAPGRWGSFGERTALDVDSRSWGRFGGGGDGANLPLVFRHRGRMDAAFWDGHVAMLSIAESRNPVHWAPSGSVLVDGPRTDPDALTFGYEGAPVSQASSRPARSILP